jgi:tetratricopeptide (TPR) repeat protein
MRGLARLALEKAPFVPLAAATAVLAAAAQSSGHATLTMAEHGLLQRCAQAAYGLLFYPWKTLLPTGLSTLYLLEADLDATRPVYLLSSAGVVLLAFGAWRLRERLPALAVALACYAVLVSPVLGFLQSGGQKVADRYSYLAAIPLSALVAAWLFARVQEDERRRAWLAGAAAVLVLLGGLAWRQTRVWRDSLTLWGRAVELEPDNYVAHLNLAAALREEGRLAEARTSASRSIEARSDARNVYARFFLGLLWLEEGDFEQALTAWRDALGVDPTDTTTLAVATRELAQRGRGEEASALLQAAYSAAPDDLEVAALAGDFLAAAGQAAEAERVWRRGLLQDPGWVAGHLGLARAVLARTDLATAERELRAALEGEPDHVEALLLLGRVLRARGRVAEAEAAWQRVLTLEPSNAEAEALLRQSRAAAAEGR